MELHWWEGVMKDGAHRICRNYMTGNFSLRNIEIYFAYAFYFGCTVLFGCHCLFNMDAVTLVLGCNTCRSTGLKLYSWYFTAVSDYGIDLIVYYDILVFNLVDIEPVAQNTSLWWVSVYILAVSRLYEAHRCARLLHAPYTEFSTQLDSTSLFSTVQTSKNFCSSKG